MAGENTNIDTCLEKELKVVRIKNKTFHVGACHFWLDRQQLMIFEHTHRSVCRHHQNH